MTTDPRTISFEAFYSAQAPAVFDLALRHAGDHRIATECVTTVFDELRDHWSRIRDPLRFCRRAAVLFVCGSRRGRGVRIHDRVPGMHPARRRARAGRSGHPATAADQHLPQP